MQFITTEYPKVSVHVTVSQRIKRLYSIMLLIIGIVLLLDQFCFGKCTIHTMFNKHANTTSHGHVLKQKQKENAFLYKNILITLFWPTLK